MYNWKIYDSVKAWFKENCDQDVSNEEIDHMSKFEVLSYFLEWEGIIGYESAIGSLIDDLFDKR